MSPTQRAAVLAAMGDACIVLDDLKQHPWSVAVSVMQRNAREVVRDAKGQLTRDAKRQLAAARGSSRKGCAYCGGRIDGASMGWSVCSACNMTRSF
jgi:hypothetical protein